MKPEISSEWNVETYKHQYGLPCGCRECYEKAHIFWFGEPSSVTFKEGQTFKPFKHEKEAYNP